MAAEIHQRNVLDCDDEMVDCGETTVSKRSLFGLDSVNFFLADVRDGIGPYLGISIILIALSCLAIAFFAVKPVIYAAQIIAGTSAAIIGPAVAAITLGLVGHKKTRPARRAQRINRTRRQRFRGTRGRTCRLLSVERLHFLPRRADVDFQRRVNLMDS